MKNPVFEDPNLPKGVYKFLDLSTAHITQNDNLLLNNLASSRKQPVVVNRHECGYYIHVPALDVNDHLKECQDAGLSEMFISLLKYAMQLGCWMIRLDRDAIVLTDLPTSKW